MHRFGTGEEADVLRSRIRPFLLRRLKGDVLRELPEKVEITLTADMTEEQRRVYQASLCLLYTSRRPLHVRFSTGMGNAQRIWPRSWGLTRAPSTAINGSRGGCALE